MSSVEKTDSAPSSAEEDTELDEMERGVRGRQDPHDEEQEPSDAEDGEEGEGTGDQDEEDEGELRQRKRDLKKRRVDIEKELKQARKAERDELLGTGGWDLDKEEHKEIKGTWHLPFFRGDDWTAEEKAALHSAWVVLTVGTLVGACTALANGFTLTAATSNAKAADLRAGNATVTEQGFLDHQATAARYTVASATTAEATAVSVSLGALLGGIVSYRAVCAKHAERIRNLNRPRSTVRREELENYFEQLDTRLDEVRAKLKELRDRASDEVARMESGGGGSQSS